MSRVARRIALYALLLLALVAFSALRAHGQDGGIPVEDPTRYLVGLVGLGGIPPGFALARLITRWGDANIKSGKSSGSGDDIKEIHADVEQLKRAALVAEGRDSDRRIASCEAGLAALRVEVAVLTARSEAASRMGDRVIELLAERGVR